ncbi:hypothetical protein BDY17DRAFT_292502 [Neohortaea acidophila]|uniref:Uncharacterized protein n=1 Tax=Neohortaea acidophila TaxID=245834 RepID=A0A6A6PYL0_9PEZI|nr:uncharacterized protein BDY17DRAFT_292502 [Neohortaea acidophila]KAF2484856.1 hypothetical protein BDY17DRAFT_292502 [Neohortaea acidophila]
MDDKKKGRLSGKLFGKKDKEPAGASEYRTSSNSNMADSAYASSEGERKPYSPGADTMPMENTGQFQGVSSDRSLTLNKSTGDVMDDDTGEVVSTVTTTTTTTTVCVYAPSYLSVSD